jgi:hypothetical protein
VTQHLQKEIYGVSKLQTSLKCKYTFTFYFLLFNLSIMSAWKKTTINSDTLRQKLKVKHFHYKNKLKEKYPHIEKHLKGLDPGKIREHSAKLISAGAMAGALILTSPADLKLLPAPQEILGQLGQNEGVEKEHKKDIVINVFQSVLPANPGPLSRNEEKLLERIFDDVVKIKSKTSLEGERLNTSYGIIGIEQHLKRYPGDSLKEHGDGQVLREGIAPGLGAWGYFAPSREELTPELIETERWYAVVQTMYLPDWDKRHPYLRDWYKYRKVLIVNTQNGNAVVAAIADSGPAAWTGKHFGGSPEVMQHLGGQGYKKGSVILFFVDDPENKVPLGPVEYYNR